MRDDFTASTKQQLARRVGFRCSNPGCRRYTSGPHTIENRSVSIGVAAHICAASPGGSRYDAELTTNDRSSIANGIWLCQACAKLIDSDSIRYSTAQLREWKNTAESQIRQTLEKPFLPNEILERGPTIPKRRLLHKNDPRIQRLRIIDALSNRYRDLQSQMIDERLVVSLRLTYTEQGTTREHILRYFEKAEGSLKFSSELAAAIERHSYVLIIGEPGAGKTNILLDLAVSLLFKAQIDEAFPIAVVFNLGSWSEDHGGDFALWLEDVLVHGNGFNRQLARRLIRERQVIPLLDGFDEIGRSTSEANELESLRTSCLRAINRFLSMHEPEKLVICSRVNEYKSTIADAPVKAEILVEPLAIEDVKRVLRLALVRSPERTKHPFRNITAAQNMLYWIDANSSFARLVRVPFYFNLASQALCFQDPTEVLPQSDALLSKFLIERFIETKFSEFQNTSFRSHTENRYWLSCLASILDYKNEIAFELSTLQPSLLSSQRRFSFHYSFIFAFVVVSYCYGSLMLSFVLFDSPESSILEKLLFSLLLFATSICLGLFWALPAGVVGWLGIWGKAKDFATEDIRHWKLSNVLFPRTWFRVAKFGWKSVGAGLKYGLMITIPGTLFAAVRFQSFYHLYYGLAGGVFIGAFVGFAFGVIGGTLHELSSVAAFQETQSPFQKLRGGLLFHPLRWLLVMVLMLSLLTFGMFTEWTLKMKFGVICWAAVFGVIIGFFLTPFFKHFLLRYCLKRERVMPFQIVRFLDYATDLRILVRYQGKWRFRHQILQKYLATLHSH